MQTYNLINKEWIVSPTARRLYRTAAAVSLSLYISLAAIILGRPSHFLRQLVLIGVLAEAVNQVGMEAFLFRFDKSAAWKQVFWFGVMLFPPLGPALYCYFAYSRQTLKSAREDASEHALDGTGPVI